MTSGHDISLKHWGVAWVGLALALHVADEALTGFLPFYNQIVLTTRKSIAWFPFPTFSFAVWLTGLVVVTLALFAFSPLVFSGRAWLRPVAYFLGTLLCANAIGHMLASLYWGIWAPGIYSSPVLLLAAALLLLATRRAKLPTRGAGSA